MALLGEKKAGRALVEKTICVFSTSNFPFSSLMLIFVAEGHHAVNSSLWGIAFSDVMILLIHEKNILMERTGGD